MPHWRAKQIVKYVRALNEERKGVQGALVRHVGCLTSWKDSLFFATTLSVLPHLHMCVCIFFRHLIFFTQHVLPPPFAGIKFFSFHFLYLFTLALFFDLLVVECIRSQLPRPVERAANFVVNARKRVWHAATQR